MSDPTAPATAAAAAAQMTAHAAHGGHGRPPVDETDLDGVTNRNLDVLAGTRVAEQAEAAHHASWDAGRLQPAFNVLAGVEEQLRFADQKAAFLATLHSFLISALAGNVVYIRSLTANWEAGSVWILGTAFVLYVSCFLAALTFVALTVLPRLRKSDRPPSKAFFGRIAGQYSANVEGYVAELRGMTPAQWFAEIGQFIVDVSAIAVAKHRCIRRATQLTIPTVVFWLATVLTLMFAGPPLKR